MANLLFDGMILAGLIFFFFHMKATYPLFREKQMIPFFFILIGWTVLLVINAFTPWADQLYVQLANIVFLTIVLGYAWYERGRMRREREANETNE